MKFIAGIALLFLGLSSVSVQASESKADVTDQEKIELLRSALQVERKAIVARNINLSNEENRAFWPVYHEYRFIIFSA